MPEAVLDQANMPSVVPFGEDLPPDFSVLADDPTIAEPALVEPSASLKTGRDAEGRMTDEALEAARRMVEGTNLNGRKPSAAPDPQLERNADGTLTDDAVAATKAQLDNLFRNRKPAPNAETQAEKKSTFAERHPTAPEMTVEYWLEVHGTTEDFAAAGEKIANADVVIIEAGGQDAAIKASILQEIADADPAEFTPAMLDDYMQKNGYIGTKNEPVMRALYGTRKAVGSFDLSGKDFQHNLDLLAATRRVRPDYGLGGIDGTAADFTAKLQDVGRRQRGREKIMATNVEPEMERILAERPGLAEKDSLKVLAPMGKIHSTLREDVAGGDLGMHVVGEIPTDDDFNHRDQVIRRTMRGETEIPHELQMRAFAEYVVVDKLFQRLDETGRVDIASTNDFNDYIKGIAAHMSEADIRFLYRNESVDPLTPQRMDRLLVNMNLPAMPYDIDGLRRAAAQMRDGTTPAAPRR
jgi:hypothetical protein